MNLHSVTPGSKGDDKVPALTKAIAVIRCVNAAGTAGVALNDISHALGFTKSHCFNILKNLTREGWLVYDEARRTYALSPRMLTDISSIFSRRALSTVIHEELDRLSTASRLPCVLTRLERDGSFITIDRSEASAELLFSAPVGYRFAPDAPAQMRVKLAWASDEEREAALAAWVPVAHTPTTIVDRSTLRAEVRATRERGYGVSRVEFTAGVMTLAAPIFDIFGNVQMIVQVPGPAARVAAEEPQIARALLDACARLNAILGNPPGASPG